MATRRYPEHIHITRKDPQPMERLMSLFIRSSGLTAGMNTRRIFKAWDEASGAGQWTGARYFRSGTLYVTIRSSVVRSQLYFQRDTLVGRINDILRTDALFDRNCKSVGRVEKIVLK